ncbi:MAG: hypothetical protein ACOYJO_01245 [Eubacterium sp.]|jgi:hypothetical protein
MKNIIETEFERSAIKGYAVKVLSGGRCDFFFPMSFLINCASSDTLIAATDITGFRKVSEYENLSGSETLDILIGLLKGLTRAAMNYLFPWNFDISTDTIYFSSDTSLVKCRFIPRSGDKDNIIPTSEIIIKRVCDFAESLLPFVSESCVDIIEEAENELSAHAFSFDQSVSALRSMRIRVSRGNEMSSYAADS